MNQDHPTNTGAMHYILHAYDEPHAYNDANRKFVHHLKPLGDETNCGNETVHRKCTAYVAIKVRNPNID